MKKITLSLAAVALLATGLSAGDTKVSSKAEKLKFNGTHYFGYVYTNYDNEDSQDGGQFEMRRNYFQVKAYMNDTDFFRITLDSKQDSDIDGGSWVTRYKYAYLYLQLSDNTGIELGEAHRPWIDYEEHHGWWFRSVSKVALEASEAMHLSNSADLGFNIKTATDHYSSEFGIFNGEGYHQADGELDNFDQSVEWRLTYHPLGEGKKKVKPTKDEYAGISFYGQIHMASDKFDDDNNVSNPLVNDGTDDMSFYGVHAVYNNPSFLIAAQYITADGDYDKYDLDAFSINTTFRPTKETGIFARYDSTDYDADASGDKDGDKTNLIFGAYMDYNHNVRFLANYQSTTYDNVDNKDNSKILLTAEVHW